ncbi:family 1 glycosylhydrolase [Pedobacter sp. SYSU D00535]|uniref:family 1 glycosylhydrolase n=1 Tax=Pedobacter sp. SYSU D00535 TaxID=2810308 RepID=UPI001A961EA3|nr:family 1 glycosylhydrolase [Pedobacter sp. SYSU D00535]
MEQNDHIQVWGGIESTINRVKDTYLDQLEYCGHYDRETDLDLIHSLGIKMLRYPILWEKHQPEPTTVIDWSFADRRLNRLRELEITPIVGLVHHGSGPRYVNFFDGTFEEGLAAYAKLVAERFPWAEYYTPVNEPLTTARFCGLYGHWYPHKRDNYSFFKVLLSECKATVLAMETIRKINPEAKLIQTEDLGKCHATPLLQYQADLENERRWVSYELLSGKLTPDKVMWKYMVDSGIDESELHFFLEHNCPPYICGFNYYLTSERYLDEKLSRYPEQYHGGNGRHSYADIETVLVDLDVKTGPSVLLKEAWERLQLPLAITECHLHSKREEQMRWFNEMWKTLNQLKAEGVDIRAITAWALFGLYGWNSLVTRPWGDYEPGVFNLSSGTPRPTALATFLKMLNRNNAYEHPVLEGQGWWKSEKRRIYYSSRQSLKLNTAKVAPSCRPVLIVGKTGTLGYAFQKIAEGRNIHFIATSRGDMSITDREQIEATMRKFNPWAIINAAGFVDVDAAETMEEDCLAANCIGPVLLADLCKKYGIKFLSFSSDLVFDGEKNEPYLESDAPNPLNVYGRSKALAEQEMLAVNPDSLIVRTSSFFGPWDKHNFATSLIVSLKNNRTVQAPTDICVSPTYVPDLVNECYNLLLDDESGIFHLVNQQGEMSWYEFARKVAETAGLDSSLVRWNKLSRMTSKAERPRYSALGSEKGIKLPTFDDALLRYLEAVENAYFSRKKVG